MSRTEISTLFKERATERKKLLIPFFTAGFPSETVCQKMIIESARVGSDIIELGMPFSDPLADGPAIQYSSQIALERGFTLAKTLKMVSKLTRKISVPIFLMGYYNPLLAYGLARFVRDAASCGVSGLIIPDLPLEEGADLKTCTTKQGLSLTFLVAPTSTNDRIRKIGRMSSDFVYAVTVTGVTGAGRKFDNKTGEYLKRAKRLAGKPIVAGFGISNPDSAKALARQADGVVIGSALIELLRAGNNAEAPKRIGRFLRKVRMKLDE